MRYTLLTEGSSDRVLLHIVNWMLEDLGCPSFEAQFADLSGLTKPVRTLREKVQVALDYWPCDLLLVHRDADRETREDRVSEIRRAGGWPVSLPVVFVVPVHMQEAWFLFDECAIRRSVARPTGRVPLGLPKLGEVERLGNPKARLNEVLRTASELRGRRLERLDVSAAKRRLAELIADYAPLRLLQAFLLFENELRHALVQLQGGTTAEEVTTRVHPAGAIEPLQTPYLENDEIGP